MLSLRCGLIFLLTLALLGAGGCSFFPDPGPTSRDIQSETSQTVPYALIKLSPETIDILAAHEPNGLAGAFTDRRPSANITFGIGDVVDVTIFEAAAGGLFIPLETGVRAGNFINLPSQIIDNNGNISVPYRGPDQSRRPHQRSNSRRYRQQDQEPGDRTASRRDLGPAADLADQRGRRGECVASLRGSGHGCRRSRSRRHYARGGHLGTRL